MVLKDDKIEQIKEIKSFLNKRVADLLIIDNYSWSYKEEIKLKDLTKRILVFDDLANKKHFCDVLICTSFHKIEKIKSLMMKDKCKVFSGPEYSIFNKIYYDYKKISLKKDRSKIKNIMISFGGTDLRDLTALTINAFKKYDHNFNIKIVLNKLSKNFSKISNMIKSHKQFKLIHNSNNLAKLISKSDLCIGSGGISLLERCFLGLPSIVVISADNQNKNVKRFAQMKCIVNLGDYKKISEKKIINKIKKLNENNLNSFFAKNCSAVFDNKKYRKLLRII